MAPLPRSLLLLRDGGRSSLCFRFWKSKSWEQAGGRDSWAAEGVDFEIYSFTHSLTHPSILSFIHSLDTHSPKARQGSGSVVGPGLGAKQDPHAPCLLPWPVPEDRHECDGCTPVACALDCPRVWPVA